MLFQEYLRDIRIIQEKFQLNVKIAAWLAHFFKPVSQAAQEKDKNKIRIF